MEAGELALAGRVVKKDGQSGCLLGTGNIGSVLRKTELPLQKWCHCVLWLMPLKPVVFLQCVLSGELSQ